MTRHITTTNSAPGYKHESTLGGSFARDRTNWQMWSAIVFAIAAVLFAATGDLVL